MQGRESCVLKSYFYVVLFALHTYTPTHKLLLSLARATTERVALFFHGGYASFAIRWWIFAGFAAIVKYRIKLGLQLVQKALVENRAKVCNLLLGGNLCYRSKSLCVQDFGQISQELLVVKRYAELRPGQRQVCVERIFYMSANSGEENIWNAGYRCILNVVVVQ